MYYIGAKFYLDMRKFIFTLSLCMLCMASFSQKESCRTISKSIRTNESLIPKYLDTAANRGLADNYLLWNNGANLKVKIISGSEAIKSKVKTLATQWETYANVKFEFVNSGYAHIRVLLNDRDGHWSYIGSDCDEIPQSHHTMNLDTTDLTTSVNWSRVVLHEFGHALGLLHEHESPISGILWNKQKMYEEYAKTQGWSKEEIDEQLFSTYDESFTNGTSYDRNSIMHYPISTWQTLNGYSVPWNTNLSTADKSLIAALYPKKGQRTNEVTRVYISNFNKIDIESNDQKGGLSIFPSFDMTVLGNSGKVVMVVEFYDSKGNPLEDSDGLYRMGEQVSTLKTIYALAGRKVSYNKGAKKDFEFFIPYDQVELPSGENKFLVRFRVLTKMSSGKYKTFVTSKVFSNSLPIK